MPLKSLLPSNFLNLLFFSFLEVLPCVVLFCTTERNDTGLAASESCLSILLVCLWYRKPKCTTQEFLCRSERSMQKEEPESTATRFTVPHYWERRGVDLQRKWIPNISLLRELPLEIPSPRIIKAANIKENRDGTLNNQGKEKWSPRCDSAILNSITWPSLLYGRGPLWLLISDYKLYGNSNMSQCVKVLWNWPSGLIQTPHGAWGLPFTKKNVIVLTLANMKKNLKQFFSFHICKLVQTNPKLILISHPNVNP